MRTHILIQRGEQPSAPGPAECFTGTVRIEHLFSAHVPARASGSSVEFRPGARTAWHSHPLGQTLIVTSGKGLVQEWNGPVQEVRPGDVVWFPPDVKHWHGAKKDSWFSHIAVEVPGTETSNEWLEPVSDETYGRLG